MAENLKICFGVPSPENLHYLFVNARDKMFAANKLPVTFINMVSSRIAFNRNMIVKHALENDCSHVLFVDADTIFPENGLERLLAYDLDIVGATTSKRKEGGIPAGEFLNKEEPVKPLEEMVFIGCPFLLIKTSVFKVLEAPYFAEPPAKLLGLEGDRLVPEDEYFCLMAKQAGFRLWCDMKLSMELGHVGSKIYAMRKVEIAE